MRLKFRMDQTAPAVVPGSSPAKPYCMEGMIRAAWLSEKRKFSNSMAILAFRPRGRVFFRAEDRSMKVFLASASTMALAERWISKRFF